MSRRQAYRFGDYELDVANEMLTRGGRPVSIQALPFRVLTRLIERAGELVRREELIRDIWGDAYVDAERGLNTAMRKVRLALGPPGRDWIQTVRGRGYRFTGPIGGPRRLGPARVWDRRTLSAAKRSATAVAATSLAFATGLLVGPPRVAPPPLASEPVGAVPADHGVETCAYERTLRIAIEPLSGGEAVGATSRLGRALAEDIAGTLWSIEGRRLAALRTWEPDVDLTGLDYVLNGRIRSDPGDVVLELELTPARGDRPAWRGTIRLPSDEPFLLPDRMSGLVDHLSSVEA